MAKHLYCVVSRDGGDAAISGDCAYLVPYRDIALVVKESPPINYASLPKDILVRHLANHQSLIEGIMKECTAVPIKFGTSAMDDGELLEILESGYPCFKNAIDSMAGKVEVDLIALWNDLDSTLRELGERDEIRRFKEEIATACQEELRKAAIELGKMVRVALEEENGRVGNEILFALKEHHLEQRIREHFDDRMLLNVAFLVEREKKNALDEQIEGLDKRYCGRINFRVVGPLPPHSFNTLEICIIGAGEIEEAMNIIGVVPGDDKDEVRKAYRKQLRKYHPDNNSGDPDAQMIFEKFSRAYKILTGCSTLAFGKDAIMVRIVE